MLSPPPPPPSTEASVAYTGLCSYGVQGPLQDLPENRCSRLADNKVSREKSKITLSQIAKLTTSENLAVLAVEQYREGPGRL